MKDFWEQRYTEEAYAYGTEPNVFFAEQLARLPPGRLLLPAEGEGRNAVWAAQQGWTVDAFDYAEAGRAKALLLAAARGVSIGYSIATFDDAPIAAGTYDAVAIVFAHVPSTARTAVHRKLAAALRPGGTLIMESFTKDQLQRGTGGPKSLDMLYDPTDLQADFKDLDIKLLETLEVQLTEGPYHQGLSSVVRLLATHPAP